MINNVPNREAAERIIKEQEQFGIKPYICNNYEGFLPVGPRNQYKSYPANIQSKVIEKPQTEGVLIVVDLSDVKSKKEVIERFHKKFGFGDVIVSWDSLGDYLWYLKESSAIFTEINPRAIHLRVININHMWSFSEKDYGILCEILTTTTDNSRFSDGFFFSFEVLND